MKSAQKSVTYRCVTVILSAILVVVSLSLTGCSFQSLIPSGVIQNSSSQTTADGQGSTASPSTGTAGNVSVEQTNKPTVLPTYRNPLTGLTSPADLSWVRPVAVCIGNAADVRSQYGIGSAEILVEAPVEDGTTRLLALTNNYTKVSKFGAIRSARGYLFSLAEAFGAVSVCDGTSDNGARTETTVYDALDAKGGGLSTVFFRESELFTSGTRLLGAMENFAKRGPTTLFSFHPEDEPVTPEGGTAGGVAIPFSSSHIVQFVYHRENGQYMRMQNGKPHTATESGEQLGFTNLLLLICESSTYNKVSGTELDLNVTDGGTGYYLSAGGYVEILWSRSENGALTVTDMTGEPITLNSGSTYIGLIDLLVSSSIIIVQ